MEPNWEPLTTMLTLLSQLWPLVMWAGVLALVALGRRDRTRPGLPSRLYRRTPRRQLLGVCVGVAEYFGLNLMVLRTLTLLACLFVPRLALAYLVLGFLLSWHPEDRQSFLSHRLLRKLRGAASWT